MIVPTESELYGILRALAEKSDCDKLRFGAVVLSKSGAILGTGFNHNPMPSEGWSCEVNCVGKLRKGVRSGTCVERCFSVHAEQAALLSCILSYQNFAPYEIARDFTPYEIAVAGWWPNGEAFDNQKAGFYCSVCARIMAEAEIRYVRIWRGGEGKRVTIEEAWRTSYKNALEG